jgi:hypothetical protein
VAKKKPKKKHFAITSTVTIKYFYRVRANSAVEAKQLFSKEGHAVEFVTKVKKLEEDITVEEL